MTAALCLHLALVTRVFICNEHQICLLKDNNRQESWLNKSLCRAPQINMKYPKEGSWLVFMSVVHENAHRYVHVYDKPFRNHDPIH